QIADSMVRIAYARGWSEIKVSGTETFRREVWLKATILGMSVKGYVPTEQDKVALAVHSRGEATNKIEKDEYREREKNGREKEVVKPEAGLLIAYGAAKYLHDENNTDSFYVTTRAADGSEQTVWGVDLQRAIDESGVKTGDEIFVNNVGRKDVTVTVPQYDEKGKVSGSREIQTHRNEWNIKMAEAFATQAPAEAVKNYPELAGAVAAVAAIDKKAVADGLSAPQRAIVSARARENAVNSIAKGQIPNVKIQNQEVERQTEEEYSR
ncbi:MAG: LPD7 domain-containing protein, partial [Nitrosospira sp.]